MKSWKKKPLELIISWWKKLCPASNLYFMASALNLYLPGLALNLCSLVLRFTVKVCYVIVIVSAYINSVSAYMYSQTCMRRPLLGPLKIGRLIKYLYKTTINQIWFVLDRVLVFNPTVFFFVTKKICRNKDLQFHVLVSFFED